MGKKRVQGVEKKHVLFGASADDLDLSEILLMTLLDGQKEDSLVDPLGPLLGEQGREKEFVGAGRRAKLGGDMEVLCKRTRVLDAVVVKRRKAENVTTVVDALKMGKG
jgi:hypothetical protein